MNAPNFLRSQFDDPRITAQQTLQCYKTQLETLRQVLLHQLNPRELTPENIKDWDRELRCIIGDVDGFRSSFFIDDFISSVDQLQSKLQKLLHNLYLVCDILEKEKEEGRITLPERDILYKKWGKCPEILNEAIGCFHI